MGRIFLIAHHPNLQAALALIIEHQSQRTLRVVGATREGNGSLSSISQTHPDVVVLVVGVQLSSGLRLATDIRRLVPSCRVLLVDTLGQASIWKIAGWGDVDALLRSEQLETDLVPTIRRLVARQGMTPRKFEDDDVPSPARE